MIGCRIRGPAADQAGAQFALFSSGYHRILHMRAVHGKFVKILEEERKVRIPEPRQGSGPAPAERGR